LARATIVHYVPFIRSFLKDRFGDGPVTPSQLRAADIVRFVRQQAARLRPIRAKTLTSALRSFLQYLRYRGEAKLARFIFCRARCGQLVNVIDSPSDCG
jgi:hypothetical protein